jgi:hypothetical protein
MDDLEEDGIACLESGFTQILPVRDSSGRPMHHCWTPALRPRDCSIEARLCACFYGAMIAFWDEETQKKGIVFMVYLIGERTTEFDPNFAWKLPALAGCMPTRVASCHVCVNDSKLNPLIALGFMVTGGYTQLRHRYHRSPHAVHRRPPQSSLKAEVSCSGNSRSGPRHSRNERIILAAPVPCGRLEIHCLVALVVLPASASKGSPSTDTSDWPTWARERHLSLKKQQSIRSQGSQHITELMDSLALSEDSNSAYGPNPFRRTSATNGKTTAEGSTMLPTMSSSTRVTLHTKLI